MSTDIDWQHELDSSFGAGHDVAPGHYLAAGRTAVRRRRATAVVLVAAVVIGGGAAWASGQGAAVRGDAPVATEGADGQHEVTTPDDTSQRLDKRERRLERMRRQADKPDFLGEPATLDANGLVLAPGAGPVLERVENPMGYTRAQGQSLGIRVMFRGREKYSLLTRDVDGATSMGTNDATGDFAGWLAGRVASVRALDGTADSAGSSVLETPDKWLSVGPDGSIESATPFVAVMEVREGADLVGSFATDTDRAGLARLQVTGTVRYVAWRVLAGDLEVVPAPGSFDSMAAFVRWAGEQYASGEGMR